MVRDLNVEEGNLIQTMESVPNRQTICGLAKELEAEVERGCCGLLRCRTLQAEGMQP